MKRVKGAKHLKRAKRGMTLVEVCVAIVLLAILATSNSVLTMRFADRQRAVSLGAYRTAELNAAVNTFIAMPYDSLAARVGCDTVSTPELSYQRCVTVTTVSASHATVRIVTTPSRLLKPDTLVIDRARSAAGPFGS